MSPTHVAKYKLIGKFQEPPHMSLGIEIPPISYFVTNANPLTYFIPNYRLF
jgi:hypothetical protein